MRVNLVGVSNGVGLSRDLDLLAQALIYNGCDVRVTAVDPRTSQSRRSRLVQWWSMCRCWFRNRYGKSSRLDFAVNIMLEHIWPETLPEAGVNVLVPNPEWFDRHDARLLSNIDCIWAKTNNTRAIFTRLGQQTAVIGFDSEDRFDARVTRKREFFHLAGKSSMKGTQKLLNIWRQHPNWPILTVVGNVRSSAQPAACNIVFHDDYLNDAELKKLQNACLFHLCTSETEGWGHYLAESMSVGGVTITLNAPPMSELITEERGLLLACYETRLQKLAQCYSFDADGLAAAVECSIAMPDAELARYSRVAREWFLSNKLGFNERIKHALAALNV